MTKIAIFSQNLSFFGVFTLNQRAQYGVYRYINDRYDLTNDLGQWNFLKNFFVFFGFCPPKMTSPEKKVFWILPIILLSKLLALCRNTSYKIEDQMYYYCNTFLLFGSLCVLHREPLGVMRLWTVQIFTW